MRAALWPDEPTAARVIGTAVSAATVAVGNRAECRVAVGTDEQDAAADELLARGAEVAIVKLGAAGVLVATPDGRSTVAARRVEVVCGLLAGWEPQRCVEYANAAGAIVAGRLLCADAMPTDAEVLGLMRTPTL